MVVLVIGLLQIITLLLKLTSSSSALLMLLMNTPYAQQNLYNHDNRNQCPTGTDKIKSWSHESSIPASQVYVAVHISMAYLQCSFKTRKTFLYVC